MRSIKRVDIKNFQVHKNLSLDFSNFTAIVGPSDTGKSAIVRAISWCLFNDLQGDWFINYDADRAEVKTYFDDGLCITRAKSTGGENSYYITNEEDLNIKLDNFGSGPVKEVIEAHGMNLVDFFEENRPLNIFEQLASPFFLAESPTRKALMIGKLANAEVIDLAIKNSATELRAKKSEEKRIKAKIKEIKSELKEYNKLPSQNRAIEYSEKRVNEVMILGAKIDNIKKCINGIDEYNKKHKICEKLYSNLESIQDGLDEVNNIKEYIESVNKLNKLAGTLDSKREQLAQINKMASDYNGLAELTDKINEIIDLKQYVKSLKDINNKYERLKRTRDELKEVKPIEEVNEIISIIDNLQLKVELLSRVNMISDKVNTLKSRKDKGNSVIESIDKEYSSLIDEYKDLMKESGTCPTCGSEFKNDSELSNIEKIL